MKSSTSTLLVTLFNVVAVTIPVTVIPFGKSGAPSPALFFILSARIIDRLLFKT